MSRYVVAAALLCVACAVTSVSAQGELHGSGTTNPQKFFWKVMDILEERARMPVTMTYRGVGSSTGQKEFIGAANTPAYDPYGHFGSGDIPFTLADHTLLSTTQSKAFMQVPFQAGLISFFHNIPADDLSGTAAGKINLDKCTLSGIFQGNITTWDHAAIKALNPASKIPAGTMIKVVRRIYGSSSTSTGSLYLSTAGAEAGCVYPWVIGVGSGDAASTAPTIPTKAPFWPASTAAAEGSGGMSDYISANAYSIGYIDSGHGHALNLPEIALKNTDGMYLNSKEADVSASVTAETLAGRIPTTTAGFLSTWHGVTLMNKAGAKAWPIVTFSYLYIRKDLTALGESGALVKAFAQMVLSPAGQKMVPEFGFSPVPETLRAAGLLAVNTVTLGTGITDWEFEDATAAGTGMAPKVFSVKRASYADVERGLIVTDVTSLKAKVADLQMNEVVQLHGSGTTNPQKMFWKTMDILEERAMVPMTMTYRAVGSGTGQYEFIGEKNTAGAFTPYNHFGSGDIPIPQADYDKLKAASKDFVQIPFVISTISFFHSVPMGVMGNQTKIDLDACTLSAIFQLQITMWNDVRIMAQNPGLMFPKDSKINVVRRIYGSSSTSLTSEYLDLACPGQWKIGVGSGDAATTAPTIPTKDPRWGAGTIGRQGSGGVSDYISANAYSIGYLESGHGHALNLNEIELKNANGKYVNSKTADVAGVVNSAGMVIPAADASWAATSLMNKAGDATWPICTFSYLYIRKDLTSLGRSGAAVKAFAEFILSAEGQGLAPEFAFVKIPDSLRAVGLAGLAQLKLSADATPYIFESASSTLKGTGMMPFTLSGKRQSYADYERNAMSADMVALKAEVAALKATMAMPKAAEAPVGNFFSDPQEQVDAAMALGALGFVLGFIALIIGSVALVKVKAAAAGGGGNKYGGSSV